MTSANPALPPLSVIVLNYRAADATVACLQSLEAGRYPGDLELLVLDNGSGDGSAERLAAYRATAGLRVRVLASPTNLGFAGGVNRVWPEARGQLVCLLNNDATVHADCLARLAAVLTSRPDLGAVWPYDAPPDWRDAQRLPDPDAVARLRNGTQSVTGANIWLPLLRDYRECFVASGVCVMVRRAQVERPFLDEYFAYHEDAYLGWRLRLRGLAAERVPEAVIYHEGSGTGRDQPRLRPLLAFHAEKNRLVNLLLFYAPATLLKVAPLLLLDEAKKWLVALGMALRGAGGPAYLAVFLRARVWVARHLMWVIRQRRVVQRERRVGDEAIVRLLSGRVTMSPGPLGASLNFLSLAYCRLVGLRTCERHQQPQTFSRTRATSSA